MTGIPWILTRTVAPAGPVVQVAELKGDAGFLRITQDSEDPLLEGLVQSAEDAIESECSLALLDQTFTLQLEQFPCWEILLPRPPLMSVTSVVYIDQNGAPQTLAGGAYVVELSSGSTPGRIYPVYGTSWPATRCQPNAVTITYHAGATIPESVPAMLRTAIKLTVGEMYEHRERSAEQVLHDLTLYERLTLNYRCVWEPRYF